MTQEQGILTGSAILGAYNRGDIRIEPFEEAQLNPASYDLRLGSEIAVYEDAVYTIAEEQRPCDGMNLSPYTGATTPLDAKRELRVRRFTIGPRGFVLKSGIGYLAHTAERVRVGPYVACVDGKSSIGRLFILVHATAGYVDPGFDGQLTLEITVTHPVRVYAGMRIAQLRFHTLVGHVDYYRGNYTGENATGAVASRAWKQFEEDGK